MIGEVQTLESEERLQNCMPNGGRIPPQAPGSYRGLEEHLQGEGAGHNQRCHQSQDQVSTPGSQG